MKRLRELVINTYADLNLSEVGRSRLMDAVASLPPLSKLFIRIIGQFAQEPQVFFANPRKALLSHPFLVDFKFHLYETNVTDDRLVSIADGLASLTQLHKVSIIVFNEHWITDESVSKLCEALANIPTLADVELDILSCPQLGKSTIQGVAEMLRKCRQITKFRFGIPNCMNIGDDEVSSVASELRTHKKITGLAFNFTSFVKLASM
eukprot:TRINITY_DN3454_c0_g1_i9.p2 TRINITY_DN3454_c0_g1~~TRINITY_DN3454_c0_g1_i9.p2  ORF type:complete len:207 (-),score=31.77 TRINITY_DN3454_c0_g1_i9:394-1014(-)